MSMTIKEIADLAGVSRGTVDRVLHKRGGVKPEVRNRVEKLLDQVQYKPNTVAQALKYSQNPLVFGLVINDTVNPFWLEIIRGFRKAEQELESNGVKIIQVNMEKITAEEQLRCIHQLAAQKVNGLFLAGIQNVQVEKEVEIISRRIPVITYNTDISNSGRLCFVGQNHQAAGNAAGKLMSMMLKRDGDVAVYLGSGKTQAHEERFSGFREVMERLRPDIRISVFSNMDQNPCKYHSYDEEGYQIAKTALENPNLCGFYVTGEGSIGIAKALKNSGRRPEVKMLSYDVLPEIAEAVEEDVIDFTIAQEEFLQGYLPVKLMYQYLAFGIQPPKKKIYTDIDIRIRENIHYRKNQIDARTYLK